MSKNTLHIVGFGSQGTAWAQCLRKSGWNVCVYLYQKGRSYEKAQDLGFQPELLSRLPEALSAPPPVHERHWVAMQCPDSATPGIYSDFIRPIESPVGLILAHGFAVFSGDLKLNAPAHIATLLAPKAIGPKIWENFQKTYPDPHPLVAAVTPTQDLMPYDALFLKAVANSMGFSTERLVPATFAQETVGDLISEQGLLCGAVFNFLSWTLEAMDQAGIPDALIREECLTELELIAGLIRDRGPASTFKAISSAAQAGTIAIRNILNNSDLKERFMTQMKGIEKGQFNQFFKNQEWKKEAESLHQNLSTWEDRLNSVQTTNHSGPNGPGQKGSEQ